LTLAVEGNLHHVAAGRTLHFKSQMKGISIDPALMKEDEAEILEDLIIAAHQDAKSKVEEETARRTQELTAGLPIPPGMKLPFG
ncbi:MAG: YbaB/EbfC family nucleoid-associated protein, partial [Pseudomonadota bacterium]